MSYKGLDPLFNIQRLAPTETGGRSHAEVRKALSADIGRVTITTFSNRELGTASVGDGNKTAYVIVNEDGLGGSGCPVYTPAVLIVPEKGF